MNHTQSDKEFFDDFIQASQTTFKYLDDLVFIKNDELKMYYVSPAYLKFLHQDTPLSQEDILGKDIIELKLRDNEELLKSMTNDDELVKQTKTKQKFMCIDSRKNIFVVFKRPVINPATDNCVGIIAHITTLVLPNLMKMLLKINNKTSYIISNESNYNQLEYKLTERQHIVLFLYLHRYSAAEIASILGTLGYKMSNSRINDHLEALKFIFRVRTKDQLIEKALAMDYNSSVPRALLREGTYLMDEAVNIM